MKFIAVITADLERAAIGTRSRQAELLAGIPIFRRTVERVCKTPGLDRIVVTCPSEQFDRCVTMVDGTRAVVLRLQIEAPSSRTLIRTARKWSQTGWRGGLGGTTWYDEYVDCRVLSAVLEQHPADAVLVLPGDAVVVDPQLLDRMLRQRARAADDVRLVFAPTPPGLSGLLLDGTLIRELAASGVPIGWLFGYQPDQPRRDLLFLPCCCEVSPEIRYAIGRLTADTDRSILQLDDLVRTHPEGDATVIGRWLHQRESGAAEPFPVEVEIELTTEDPYPDAVLRPRGNRVPRRGPIEPDLVLRIIEEAGSFDDALITLGGFGDPLRHPRFGDLLAAIRRTTRGPSVPFGLAVRTTGVDLDQDRIDTMIEQGVDVLCVPLDAWTPDLYGRLQSPGDPAGASLDSIRRRLDLVAERRAKQGTAYPIVVPEMCKSRLNVQELDAFHDGWMRRLGAVLISGDGHRAGQFPDHRVINMAPNPRGPCRRLRHRCLVLADGRVVPCDQDFRGIQDLGSLLEHSLGELWSGSRMVALRNAHRAARIDSLPLCPACDEWHRP